MIIAKKFTNFNRKSNLDIRNSQKKLFSFITDALIKTYKNDLDNSYMTYEESDMNSMLNTIEWNYKISIPMYYVESDDKIFFMYNRLKDNFKGYKTSDCELLAFNTKDLGRAVMYIKCPYHNTIFMVDIEKIDNETGFLNMNIKCLYGFKDEIYPIFLFEYLLKIFGGSKFQDVFTTPTTIVLKNLYHSSDIRIIKTLFTKYFLLMVQKNKIANLKNSPDKYYALAKNLELLNIYYNNGDVMIEFERIS